MANILVLGVGPLPFEPSDKLHAPGLRTWQLAEVLARQRHHVTIGVIEFGQFDPSHGMPQATRREDLGTHISLVRLQYHPQITAAALSTLHRGTRFTCIVSTTDIMNSVAAVIPERLPLWLDYNGDPFAEKQLQGLVHHSDAALLDQWRMYFGGLYAGDRFSCASTMQRQALIGQLAFAGRLNQHNCGEELIHVMPNCSRAVERDTRRKFLPVKGHLAPTTAFLALWSGGYNTWSDPVTLFQGLEMAIEADPTIYFASTGGAISGHDNESFRRFETLVESSRFRDHYIFLGWRSTDEMGSIFEQSDVALNVDRYSVEAELGTRTRMVEWLQFQVPVVSTALSELPLQLQAQNLITTFDVGSAEGLRDAILKVKSDHAAAKARAAKAREFFEAQFNEEKIFAPLLKWAEAPHFAKDRALALERRPDLPVDLGALWRLVGFHKYGLHQFFSPAPASSLKRFAKKILPWR